MCFRIRVYDFTKKSAEFQNPKMLVNTFSDFKIWKHNCNINSTPVRGCCYRVFWFLNSWNIFPPGDPKYMLGASEAITNMKVKTASESRRLHFPKKKINEYGKFRNTSQCELQGRYQRKMAGLLFGILNLISRPGCISYWTARLFAGVLVDPGINRITGWETWFRDSPESENMSSNEKAICLFGENVDEWGDSEKQMRAEGTNRSNRAQ